MPRTGEPVSTAPGSTRDKVLDLHAAIVMGGIRVDVEPWSYYRSRNYAMFVNGVWKNNQYHPSDLNTMRMSHPINPGTTNNLSVAVVEVGDHEQFDEAWFVPGGWTKEEEAADSARFRVQWVAGYFVDEVNGENSLASVVLTGITRYGNCEPDNKFPLTRGRVWYTIEAIGGDRYVRLWANGSLISSGFRTGDGLVTFTENNGSGVTGTCILTYTADVIPNQAFLLIRWAEKYNLHYSTSALSYPRTPEMVIYDKGVSRYIALTPVLPAGAYNYALQAVGDDGTLQSPVPTPSDSPKTIKVPPIPITWGTPTGNAAALTLNWTTVEPGTSFTVYHSNPDEPVNIGQWSYPLPILRPLGANSATFPAITGYAPVDREPYWNSFVSSIDSIVIAVNTAYDAGYTGFVAILDTQESLGQTALQTLSNAVVVPTTEHAEQMAILFENLRQSALASADAPTTAYWQSAVYSAQSTFLNGMSLILDGNTQRYTFTDGSLPWSGTGVSDGDAGSNEAGGYLTQTSVKKLITPFVTNRKIRCICRSLRLSDSIQEVSDEVLTVELDSTGAIVLPRPNASNISNITASNLTVTFKVQAVTDDQVVAAYQLAVYYVAAPADLTYTSPAGTVVASSEITGVVSGDIVVVFPAPGYYIIGSKSITAGGVLSKETRETTIWVGTEQPAAPTGVSAEVIRDKPVEPVEDN
jgi:hypothetical protein